MKKLNCLFCNQEMCYIVPDNNVDCENENCIGFNLPMFTPDQYDLIKQALEAKEKAAWLEAHCAYCTQAHTLDEIYKHYDNWKSKKAAK